MNKFQKVNFRTIYDFLDYIPEDERIVVESLREIILDAIPNGTERLKFNVPYYSQHNNICFLWPSSIPWGAVDKGVSLGFTKGHLITSGIDYLEDKGRKTVRSKEFLSIKEIDFELIKIIIYEAVEIDIEMSHK